MLCGNKTDLNRQVSSQEGQSLADKEKMIFFETSAKVSTNVSLMMYTCIAELPFFEQFQTDRETLIKELESINAKGVQNSIYDIVKSQSQEHGGQGGLNVNNQNNTGGETNTGGQERRKKVEEEKKKCGC